MLKVKGDDRMNKRTLTQKMLLEKRSFKDCGFNQFSVLPFSELEQCAHELLSRTVQFLDDGTFCFKDEWLLNENYLYLKYFTDIDTDPFDTPEGREMLWWFYHPVFPEADLGIGWSIVQCIYDNLKQRKSLEMKNRITRTDYIDNAAVDAMLDALAIIHQDKEKNNKLLGFNFSKK